MQIKYLNEKGLTFVELVIVVALIGLIGGSMLYGMFKYRNDVEADVVVDEMLASINFARNNAVAGKNRTSYGVIFYTNYYVNFEGNVYVSSSSLNKRTDLPPGLYLVTTCAQIQNNTVLFSTIKGENNNECDVQIKSSLTNEILSVVQIRNLGTIRVVHN